MYPRFFIYPAAILFCSSSSKNAKKPVKPSIISMLPDDPGHGDLGCFGQMTIETPEIDKTVPMGARRTNHYAGSTVNAPSQNVISTVG